MDGVAKTSLLVAAMRAAETNRTEERLFIDPFAEKLAGPEGKELLQRAIAESGDQPAIAIRTFYIDKKMIEAVSKGIRQIVILAAGMDARAYRLKLPAGTHVFELDRAEVLKYKQDKLSGAKPTCDRHEIGIDLREEWQGELMKAGFKKDQPTLWLVEGLLMYLEEAQVMTLMKRINTLASSGDHMLFDILSRTLLEVPHMKKQIDFLASMGAPWKFGVNDPAGFMQSLGWKAELSQAGEVAPTRWPFPTAPLGVLNIPRGFYVQAVKI